MIPQADSCPHAHCRAYREMETRTYQDANGQTVTYQGVVWVTVCDDCGMTVARSSEGA